MRNFLSIILFISILFLTSCVEQRILDANQVAIINGYEITVESVENQGKALQLEKLLYEYNRFRNNIYPKLELLSIKPSIVDDIIFIIQQGKLDEAKAIIQNLTVSEDKNIIKYFIIKEIDSYESLLNKQNLYYAYQQAVIDAVVFQELEERQLHPSSQEIEKAYQAYLNHIQKDIENNIFYQYYYEYAKNKEMELFELNTEEAYKQHLYKKIERDLSLEKFKKAIGSYDFENYIRTKLENSEIIFNKQFEHYRKEVSIP
ncbi:MAG: hypothetical protein AB2421_04670 [Thermotaleaceae bacterium]